MREFKEHKKPSVSSDTFFKARVQPKLQVGQPGDAFEQEADSVADAVVSKSGKNDIQKSGNPEEEKVQKKPIAESISSVQMKELKDEEPPVQKKEEEEQPLQKKEEEEPVQKKEEEDPTLQKKEDEEPVMKKEEEDPTLQKKKTISDEACGVQLQQILVKELSRTLEYNDRTLLLRNQVRVIRWLHRLANISKSASYYDSLIASFIKMSVSISKDQLQVNAGSNTSASIVTSESTLKSIEQKQLEKDQQSAVDKEELFEEEKRVTLNEKLQDKVEDELVQQFEKLELLGLSTDDEVLLVEISDGLLVDNAGLILLHPFLKHFFKKVALLEDDEKSFTDPFLAVHLLHFIATGIEQDFEHTLLFEKYLVGLPFEEIVPKNVVISDELKLEVVSLLEAVKENWEPLRTTSNEGLRETFLVRSGKLMNLNEHPRVVIERKTVDILLEKIDWSMSLVHFPWMEKLLYVEW